MKDRGALATGVHIRDIVKRVYAFAILHGEKADNPGNDVSAASIAKERMKGRNPHVVYLSRQALDIFEALHTCAAGSKFVFPLALDLQQDRVRQVATPHSARVGQHG